MNDLSVHLRYCQNWSRNYVQHFLSFYKKTWYLGIAVFWQFGVKLGIAVFGQFGVKLGIALFGQFRVKLGILTVLTINNYTLNMSLVRELYPCEAYLCLIGRCNVKNKQTNSKQTNKQTKQNKTKTFECKRNLRTEWSLLLIDKTAATTFLHSHAGCYFCFRQFSLYIDDKKNETLWNKTRHCIFEERLLQ